MATIESQSKLPTPPPSQAGSGAHANLNIVAPSANDPRPSFSPSAAPSTPPFSPSSTTPVLSKDRPSQDSSTPTDLDFVGNVSVTNDVPTTADLTAADKLLVLDAKGQSRPFGEIYRGTNHADDHSQHGSQMTIAPRQLVIFIRHFFCGNCQEYLREISSSVTPEELLALETPTFITVIGCGRPDLIEMYAETTNCPFPIYADPTGKLYDVLGMTRTLDLGKKPKYIQSNILVTSMQSVVQALKTGSNALKGGSFKQVGGEFLFEDGECVWVHRMRNTRDHTEMEQLRIKLGLVGEKKQVMRNKWSHGVKKVASEEDKEKEKKPASTRRRSMSWKSLGKGGRDKEKEKEGLMGEVVKEEA
ncbi:unnamed protein product [Periconia digitata]|uniref:Thioredoxin-like protein AAED1 n=1 Tax=Periconia digitata TaxID=1303443 RepID=A0A9W4UDR9_9PLEO|nr:unnamed protein product [Periconia digitata]